MGCLDVDESRDFLQSGEDLEPVGMHARIARTEREIGINLLESIERVIQDGQRSFDDGAVPEGFDVSRVDNVHSLTRLGARTVADDAFAVHRLFKFKPIFLKDFSGFKKKNIFGM